MAITPGSINGEESATVTFKVRSVTVDMNSTVLHQEVLTLGDPESTLGLARVVAAPPGSTLYGMVVRIASGPSSAVDLQMRPVFSSTAADNPVTVSGTVAVTGYSTIVSVANQVRVSNSTATDLLVRPIFSSTNADNPVRAVLSSTAADNPVLVSGNSTVVVSAFAAGLISTVASPSNSSALNVRVIGGASSGGDFPVRALLSSTNTDNPVRAILSSTAADNPVTVAGYSTIVTVANQVRVTNSTAAEFVVRPIFSSTNADNPVRAVLSSTSTDNKVALFDGSGNSIDSSTSAMSTGSRGLAVRQVLGGLLTFASTNLASTATAVVSSNAASRGFVYAYSITSTIASAVELCFYKGSSLKWPIVLQAISSAISGANLAVSPPAYLFSCSTGEAITLNVSSTGTFKVGVAYWLST